MLGVEDCLDRMVKQVVCAMQCCGYVLRKENEKGFGI